mgnify:CR=1 FL=1|jgi:hypothetical protein
MRSDKGGKMTSSLDLQNQILRQGRPAGRGLHARNDASQGAEMPAGQQTSFIVEVIGKSTPSPS